MAAERQAVEQMLTSEDFLIGSEFQGYLDQNYHAVESDFVGDQEDYDELTSNAPNMSDWKNIESDIILTYNQCRNEKLQQLKK